MGLSHSVKKRDVMYPVYGSYTSHPRLSKNDVRRLQYLYGKFRLSRNDVRKLKYLYGEFRQRE